MRITYCLVLLFLLSRPAFSQSLQQKIEKAYAIFESDEQLRYGTSSLSVLNAETGEVIFSKNGNTGLASASTLKTVTSATAFQVLGADFSYKTMLGYSGSLAANGVLKGNLVITGGGDPTLGSWRYETSAEQAVLNRWVTAVRRAGIKKIEGHIIADDRLFGTQTLPLGWIWQDIGNYYGAGPASLSWRENQFNIIFRPGNKPGDPVTLLRTEPAMPYLTLVNEVTTGKTGSGDNVYAFSAPYTTLVYLRGTYAADLKKDIAASLPDPAYEAARRLEDTLKKAGIAVQELPLTVRAMTLNRQDFTPPAKMIDTLASPDMRRMVYWFNQKSINLYGEHLIKTIALKTGRKPGTAEGAEAIKEFWNKKLGIDKDAMNIIDGSGLSPATRITTMAIARIMQSVKKEPWFKSYYESLPVYNDMKMKSGSINDVLAYAGYQTSASGVPVAFSFIINNYNGSTAAIKQKMFRVLDVLK